MRTRRASAAPSGQPNAQAISKRCRSRHARARTLLTNAASVRWRRRIGQVLDPNQTREYWVELEKARPYSILRPRRSSRHFASPPPLFPETSTSVREQDVGDCPWPMLRARPICGWQVRRDSGSADAKARTPPPPTPRAKQYSPPTSAHTGGLDAEPALHVREVYSGCGMRVRLCSARQNRHSKDVLGRC